MKFVKGYCNEGQVFRGNNKLASKKDKSAKNSPSSSDSKIKELTPSQKAKMDKDIKKMNTAPDEAMRDFQKREAEKSKSEMKAIKKQTQSRNNSGSGWHDESQRHAQARMGIKTAEPQENVPTPTDITRDSGQIKLANNIQDDMHKLDKLLRQATNLSDKKKADAKLLEAEKVYLSLSDKMKHHKNTVGELPHWVGKTWQGTEDFGKNGRVRKNMDRLLNADEDDFEKRQKDLFNAVRLPNEPVR